MAGERSAIMASVLTIAVVFAIAVASSTALGSRAEASPTPSGRQVDGFPVSGSPLVGVPPAPTGALHASSEVESTTTSVRDESQSAAALYSEHCAACHGASGEGGIGPSLQVSNWTESATTIGVAKGFGMMPGFSDEMSPAQIEAVSRYSIGLYVPGASTTVTTTPPDDAPAEALFASQCAACHGESGSGGVALSLDTSQLSAGAVIAIVANGIGTMPGFTPKLTSDQISSIASFSVALRTEEPVADEGEPSTTDPDEPVLTAAAPSQAAAGIYDANCAGCHGSLGEGRSGPSLIASAMDLDAVAGAISDGIGNMPGFASSLDSDQILDIAAFTAAFQVATGPDESAADDEAVKLPTGQGAEIYAESCAICHGAKGGGASALPINVPFRNDQLVEIIEVGIADMPGFATALSDTEIEALAEYVHALAQLSAPVEAAEAPDNEFILAIEPSRYVEFDTDRSSIPLNTNERLGIALGSLAILGLVAFGEVRAALRRSVAD